MINKAKIRLNLKVQLKYLCLSFATLALVLLQLQNPIPLLQSPVNAAVITQASSVNELVQVGKQKYQLEQFTEAIALWKKQRRYLQHKMIQPIKPWYLVT